jgi:hypothetical protein
MRWKAMIPISIVGLLLCVSLASAQGGYGISWWTVDGGGTTYSSGGDYRLAGTVGQADAGVLMGGPYALSGGFWARAIVPYHVYVPVLLRNH